MIHCIKTYFFIFAIVLIKDSIECLPFGGTWRQVGSDIDGKAQNNQFGYSVAMSSDGRTIAIGAPFNSNVNGIFAGHIRVFSVNSSSGNWTQIGSDINGKAQFNTFGSSVCISDDGRTVAAGATGNGDNGGASGHVRVYSYNATSNMWVQIGSDINGEAAADSSGYSVSMSADGQTIAIGAIYNDNTKGENSGHARVYTINTTSGNWTQVGADIDGKVAGDSAGYSVALSSDAKTIAVGAPNYDNANDADAGHVRVFLNNPTSKNWTQVGSDIYGKAAKVGFGRSVAISSDGKTIAIGAPYNNNINSNVGGSVCVYTINGTSSNWIQVGLDIDGLAVGDYFGWSVALSSDGKTIAIGAPFNSIANRTYSGHVRVFSFNSTFGNWTQVGLDINGEAEYDNSGYSVAISNDGFTLAIGAIYNNNINGQSGHVRVYKYELPPTKAPTRMPTKSPTKPPTKFLTRTPTNAPSKLPTKRPTNAPTKSPTRRPTKNPTKNPLKSPTKTPTNAPSKIPTKRPSKVPTKIPTKNPTKAPSQVTLPVPITVPIQVPSATIVPVPTNCGLFGWNFFCPRRGECGFWRRLLNLQGC